jgi:hypothetical protein
MRGGLGACPYRIPMMKRGAGSTADPNGPTTTLQTNFFPLTNTQLLKFHESCGSHHLEESGEVSGDTFWTCAVDACRQLAGWMSTWKMQRECAVPPR